MTDQLALERTGEAAPAIHSLAAGPKNILVHVQNDGTVEDRLQAALSLARAYSAHIECLHVTPIQAYVAYEGFGGVFVMKKAIDALEEREKMLRADVEGRLANEDVSWTYTQVTGDVASQLIGHAALADLLVAGREPYRSDFAGSTIGLLGDLISRSRTPIFIPGNSGKPFDPTGPALVAWDGSYEAADAVRSSIGMLGFASKVEVLQVVERKAELFPSTRLLEYLSRHDIHAELTVEASEVTPTVQEYVPDLLVTKALAMDAAFMVMGGYNHSRIGEFIFGGVTRMMLSASPVPIVIAR
ncbi:MAG TPA: universal stress protein [Sphingomicrobium sp.]